MPSITFLDVIQDWEKETTTYVFEVGGKFIELVDTNGAYTTIPKVSNKLKQTLVEESAKHREGT